MNQFKETVASWLRSYLAAALAVFMAGGTLKQMAMGGVAAIAPVVIRWLNPEDKSFGINAK